MNDSRARVVSMFKSGALKRGALFGFILLAALFAFEIFNFTTTQFALADILGANLKFLGIQWATILAIAFCGIDFAGIARLFTPQQEQNEPAEVWYLFSAWLLAAAMNAVLTWWGVSVAIRTHQELSTLIVSQTMLTKLVPVFIALLVWLIRVLIIGTFSMAGDRIFSIGIGRSPITNGSLRLRPNSQPVPMRAEPAPIRSITRPVIQSSGRSSAASPRPTMTKPGSAYPSSNLPPFLARKDDNTRH